MTTTIKIKNHKLEQLKKAVEKASYELGYCMHAIHEMEDEEEESEHDS